MKRTLAEILAILTAGIIGFLLPLLLLGGCQKPAQQQVNTYPNDGDCLLLDSETSNCGGGGG